MKYIFFANLIFKFSGCFPTVLKYVFLLQEFFFSCLLNFIFMILNFRIDLSISKSSAKNVFSIMY